MRLKRFSRRPLEIDGKKMKFYFVRQIVWVNNAKSKQTLHFDKIFYQN